MNTDDYSSILGNNSSHSNYVYSLGGDSNPIRMPSFFIWGSGLFDALFSGHKGFDVPCQIEAMVETIRAMPIKQQEKMATFLEAYKFWSSTVTQSCCPDPEGSEVKMA